MRSEIRLLMVCLSVSLILASCGGKDPEASSVETSGAKSAVLTMGLLSSERARATSRPSATLGLYTALYAAQGIFLPVRTSNLGIEAQLALIRAQQSPASSEVFALLQEVGSTLGLDIVDALNRSADRAGLLEEYIQSIRNTGILMERKVVELNTLLEELSDTRKEQRDVVRVNDRELRDALKTQDYGRAAELQETLTEAQTELSETEAKEEQTKDIMRRFIDLIEVAEQKLQAIENNRAILIAGLRVLDLPGIEDLGILEEGQKWRRRGRGDSIFTEPRGTL